MSPSRVAHAACLNRLAEAVSKPIPGMDFKPPPIAGTVEFHRTIVAEVSRRKGRLGEGWLKTLFYSTVADPEDYFLLGMSTMWPETHHGRITADLLRARIKQLHVGHPATCWAQFPEGDTGTGAIITLTLPTVYTVLKRAPRLWEKELLATNFGNPQWTVASMIFGINSLEATIVDGIVGSGMHLVPLPMWPDVFKGWANAFRRCPRLWNCGAKPKHVMMLRKIFNCCVRTKDQADWAAEKLRRTENVPMHFALQHDGSLSTNRWKKLVRSNCLKVTREIVAAMLNGPVLDDIDKWWASRWAWSPTGATTAKKLVSTLIQEDQRLNSAARPGKKGAWEALPPDYPWFALNVTPRCLARGSTKPEPGGKQRALYATDDIHQIVSGYASVHIEKFMNVWGMKGKQTPADVADWVAAANHMRPGNCWFSLDYTDYNTEHEMSTLADLNLAFMYAWAKLGGRSKVSRQKIRCCAWVAASMRNCWARDGLGDIYRTFGTLFSGSRDTARDNTILHGVYSRSVCEMLEVMGPSIAPISANFTGDDEDTLFKTWGDAFFYVLGHALAGFELKPEKQLAGRAYHEFLQRNCVAGSLPVRPMFAMLAQLASGNWYQDVHIWYDSAVSSVSSNLWELHTRGVPLPWARSLAYEIINASMRVPDDTREDGWKRLEWWSYRHGSSISPLWYGMSGPIQLPPEIEAKPIPLDSAPSGASQQWVELKKKVIPQHLISQDKWDFYLQQCLKESYSKLYTKQRSDAHKEFALRNWPERSNVMVAQELLVPGPAAIPDQLIQMWTSWAKTDRRATNTEEILARLQVDARLVELAGGLMRLLSHAPPHWLGRIEIPVDARTVPLAFSRLDSALYSWIKSAFAIPIRPVELRSSVFSSRCIDDAVRVASLANLSSRPVLTVWLAPNAAGKTTYTSAGVGREDLEHVLHKVPSGSYIMAQRHTDVEVARTGVRRQVDAYLVSHGVLELTTQFPPWTVLLGHSDRGYSIKLNIVDPEPDVLKRRLAMRAGWSEERIARSRSRWTDLLAKADTMLKTILSPLEMGWVRRLKDFPSEPAVKPRKVVTMGGAARGRKMPILNTGMTELQWYAHHWPAMLGNGGLAHLHGSKGLGPSSGSSARNNYKITN